LSSSSSSTKISPTVRFRLQVVVGIVISTSCAVYFFFSYFSTYTGKIFSISAFIHSLCVVEQIL
jgi:purine-cytosine permease-like protein